LVTSSPTSNPQRARGYPHPKQTDSADDHTLLI
jgi:hypothetical protein